MAVDRRGFVQMAAVGMTAPVWLRYAHATEAGVLDGKIHLASTLPLTGPLGRIGNGMMLGLQAAVGSVNARGGVAGRTLELHVLDDAHDPQVAEQNIQNLMQQNKVFACIACGGTPVNQRLIPFLEKQKVPYVAPFTGSDTVRKKDYTHTFHVRASYTEEVSKLVQLVSGMGIDDIGVVYSANAFGESLRDSALQTMQAMKRKVVGAVSVRMDAKDAVQAANKMLAFKPAAVFLATSGRASVKVLQELRARASHLPVFTTSVGFPPGAQTGLKEKMVGVGIMQVVPNPDKRAIKVVRDYRQALRAMTERDVPSSAGMEGYINMQVLVEGLRRAGVVGAGASNSKQNKTAKAEKDSAKSVELTREGLLAGLRSMRDWNAGGYAIDFGGAAPYEGSSYADLAVVSRSGKLI